MLEDLMKALYLSCTVLLNPSVHVNHAFLDYIGPWKSLPNRLNTIITVNLAVKKHVIKNVVFVKIADYCHICTVYIIHVHRIIQDLLANMSV